MNNLKVGSYSILTRPFVSLTFLIIFFIVTGCGKNELSVNTDSSFSDQRESTSSHPTAIVATPIEANNLKRDDGIITFDDFKGYWATFDSKEIEPFQSDIGKYTVAITDNAFVPGEWGTSLGSSDILDHTIEGSKLTLKLYTPDSNLENTDEIYLLELELIKKDSLFVLKAKNGSVVFYPVTSQEFFDAGWKIPSDNL
ncbi:hypothetical protein [Carnobacterium sp. ISL-102]|uniref:hypothetical protein n=1 Tax=Carnobacterium sp. ISL-102 TaxID=2819142 RepID=UPI001BE6B9E3|nr:hypothetical protein [Carnobacterium sp. ISL-102]MBT2731125.1 hypothetical protein [Carnobacterium sp. ISL-102]